MIDPAAFRPGKRARVAHPHTLVGARLISSAVEWPRSASWAPPSYGMYGNDRIGDCGLAAQANAERLWSAARGGTMIDVGDDAVVQAYREVGGYDPADPSTDNGVVLTEALAHWRDVGIGGRRIRAWADVRDLVAPTIAIFGLAYLGLALPITAQRQDVWDVDMAALRNGAGAAQPGSWGGHCTTADGYDDTGLWLGTYGGRQRCTWGFFAEYCDEAYAIVTDEWMRGDGRSVSGFDYATMLADLAALGAPGSWP